MQLRKPKTGLFLVVALLLAPQAFTTSVLQMNLNQLTANADSVFRGTVVELNETTVQDGLGEQPALHYKVRVDELFKGSVTTVMGVRIAEFRVLGNAKQMNAGRVLPGFPVMKVGEEYLLFVAPAGPVGLTQMMGLAQGCFTFSGHSGTETVVNGFDNVGLFKDMAGSYAASGPVAYSNVAHLIRAKLGN